MLDIHSILAKLKRPKLLVRAARYGMDEYRRDVDLLRTLEVLSVHQQGRNLFYRKTHRCINGDNERSPNASSN